MFQTTLLSRTAKSKIIPVFIFSAIALQLSIGVTPKIVKADTPTVSLAENSSLIIGQNNDLRFSLTPSGNYSDVIVNWEIYNQQGTKISQSFLEHQNLESGKPSTFTVSWKPEAKGEYQVKAGIFSSNWSQLLSWIDNAAKLSVADSSSPQSTAFDAKLSLSQTPQLGKSTNVNLSLTPASSYSDSIVDLEILNDSNQKIYQKFFEHQNLESGKPVSYSFDWTPSTGGAYKYSLGIFSANWGSTVYWTNSISTSVSSSTTPSVSMTPTPAEETVSESIKTDSSFVSAGGAYTVGKDGRIYKNGQKIRLDGVSWFGFEGGAHAPHGLWSRNWQDMVSQIKSTGFNAVRVPFCPATLKNSEVSTVEYSKNKDLVGLKSLDLLDKVLGEMNSQKLYILLDHHTPDCQALSDLWYTGGYSEEQWIQDLSFVAKRYQNLEYFMGIDIKNEPKGPATWGTGNRSTDWNTAAELAGKAVLSANSNILVFVQGIENNSVCSNNTYGHWWGGNLEPQKCHPISSQFIPSDKLVFTPHVYGPDVFNQGYFNTADFPKNLTAIWDQHFGFLKDQGKAIAIGEYGGKYGAGDPKDVAWQNAITDYFASKGICDNFYWSWNPNSGDTGGILKDDWSTPWQSKLDLLSKYRSQCK